MRLPKLYKKTSTGAIQFWQIEVSPQIGQMDEHAYAPEWGLITTTYGQLDTDSPQVTYDTIAEGKNLGKKNATTALQQAVAEATSKWEKQKKKGYVESVKGAQAGELDALIKGGISPMLAHKYSEHASKIVLPAFVQPKLDGIRCTSEARPEYTKLWSRTRKLFTSLPHIEHEVRLVFGDSGKTPDGELYNHEFRNNFERIVSAVRKENPEEGYLDVQYHVYDVAMDGPFAERIEYLYNKVHTYQKVHGMLKYIQVVPTILVKTEEELIDAFQHFRNLGYEGIMVRNLHGKYVNKRSYDLQKVKEFDEDEFPVVGIEEGRGKLAGHVGSFVCRTSSGKEFLAKMSGDTDKLREYFLDHSLWRGKLLSVQYQGLTGAQGVPRFPVGKAFRDYE